MSIPIFRPPNESEATNYAKQMHPETIPGNEAVMRPIRAITYATRQTLGSLWLTLTKPISGAVNLVSNIAAAPSTILGYPAARLIDKIGAKGYEKIAGKGKGGSSAS